MSISSKSRRRTALIGGLSAAVVMTVAANGALAATAAPKPAATTASNASCPTTPGVTPGSVNLGWIGSKTGTGGATYIGSSEAFQLRVDQENAKGGVNGRKLAVKVYNDETNPNAQVSAAQKAIQSDNIFGLSGHSSVVSMYPTLKEAGIPITGFSSPAYGTDRNAFGVTGATTSSNPALAGTSVLEKLKQAGVTKLANINHSSAAATAGANATANLVPFIGGMSQVLRIADEPQGAHDATSTALRVKNSGADGATLVGAPDGNISIAQALKQQGVNLKGLYIVGLSDPAVLRTANGSLEGAIGANFGTVPVGVNNRAVKTFAAGMKAAGLNPYSPAAPLGYLGADLLIKGLKLAGKCPTRESFISNLRALKAYDGGGMLPASIGFTPGIMPNGNPAVCSWYLIAKGTELTPDTKATCGGKWIDTATGKVILGG